MILMRWPLSGTRCIDVGFRVIFKRDFSEKCRIHSVGKLEGCSQRKVSTETFLALNEPKEAAWLQISENDCAGLERVLSAPSPELMVQRAWQASQGTEPPHELFRRLPMVLISAIAKCPTEPLAYCRALLEAARYKALSSRDTSWLVAVEMHLEKTALRVFGADRLVALQALYQSYCAELLPYEGVVETQRGLLVEALKNVPHDELEVHSRILEIGSGVFARYEAVAFAESMILKSERLARAAGASRRLPEILLRKSRLQITVGVLVEAEATLREALSAMPRGFDDRLRLEILHETLNVQVSMQRIEDAMRTLSIAAKLYGPPIGDRRLNAARTRLEGRIAMTLGDQARAVDCYELAVFEFLDLRELKAAILILPELMAAWAATEFSLQQRQLGREVVERLVAATLLPSLDPFVLETLVAFA